MKNPTVLAAISFWILTAASPTIQAVRLCDGQCDITIEFAQGGSITSDNAILEFVVDGLLNPGTDGSFQLGTDGYLNGADEADLAGDPLLALATLHLGDGGSIVFGTDGVLKLGWGGNIETFGEAELIIDNASSIVIEGEPENSLVTLQSVTGDNSATVGIQADDSISLGSTNYTGGIVIGLQDSGVANLSAGSFEISSLETYWVSVTTGTLYFSAPSDSENDSVPEEQESSACTSITPENSGSIVLGTTTIEYPESTTSLICIGSSGDQIVIDGSVTLTPPEDGSIVSDGSLNIVDVSPGEITVQIDLEPETDNTDEAAQSELSSSSTSSSTGGGGGAMSFGLLIIVACMVLLRPSRRLLRRQSSVFVFRHPFE